jgi:hypothetical protein
MCAARRLNDLLSFGTLYLLLMDFLTSAGGRGDFDAGPVALTFWCLAAILPQLTGGSRGCALPNPRSHLFPNAR